jgi:hypothetical protein
VVYSQALYRKTQHPQRRRLTRPLNGIRHSSSALSNLSVLSIGISSSRISTGSRSSGTWMSSPLRSLRVPRVARTTRMCGVPPKCVHFFPSSLFASTTQREVTYPWLGPFVNSPDYFCPPPTPQASVLTQDRTAVTAGAVSSPTCRTRICPACPC